MRIRVDNTYSDGHTSRQFYDIPDSEVPGNEWDMWDFLFEYTGDGHGGDRPELGYHYEVTIVESSRPELVGLTEEWVGS